MAALRIKAFSNCSNVLLVWEFDQKIQNCIGFAILRKEAGAADQTAVPLESSVGFEDEPHALDGGPKPSTERPFQRCVWNDWTAPRDRKIVYKVSAVYEDGSDRGPASPWSQPVILTDQHAGVKTESFFNDGVIATQWVAHELQAHHASGVEALVKKPGSDVRTRLGGRILSRLTTLLDDAKAKGQHVYAALFELNDTELEDKLVKLGAHAHVVLANGSPQKHKDGTIEIDPNEDARTLLRNSHVDLHDRIFETATGGITSHLGHNKFAVFCDKDNHPLFVWTGSTNWSWSGLCTQMNNAVVIDDAHVAARYLEQWKLLAASKADFPPGHKKLTAVAAPLKVDAATVTVSFTPYTGTKGKITDTQPADLARCAELIRGAKEGILFLMFIPGPKGTLLEEIQRMNSEKGASSLYVRGVVQQDPGPTATVPSIALAHRGELLPAPFDIVYPEAVNTPMRWWIEELKKLPQTNAIIHSKVVVVDPFGAKPVVMTGSHNLGTKASYENDENLLIIEGHPQLAAEYAVNIVTVFNQYWWRFNRLPPAKKKSEAGDAKFKAHAAPSAANLWKGLKRDDKWQQKYLPKGELRHELDFWLEKAAGARK